MHCVFFPNPEYPLPIFGADIVATPKVITAAICDISPVHSADSIYYGLDLIAGQYKFKERRQLPEWADIFSDYVQFMRIRDNKEKDMFVELVSRYLDIYIEHVYGAKRDQNWINNMKRMDDQIWYCKQQRQNKKTKAGVRMVGDRRMSKLQYWSPATTLCPEPFIDINIPPGQTDRWALRYEFYTVD